MTEREVAGQKALAFFEDLWKRGDPWSLESSDFEKARYAFLLALLGRRRYEAVLEIGCGAGAFTRLLAGLARAVVALDISPTAIARARAAGHGHETVEFRVGNVMNHDLKAGGPWDLVVMSETIYYLGWLYPFFDIAWLGCEIFAATRPGGRLLLTNTQGELEDYLVRPWHIRTYRDLFVNVGYVLEREEIFHGAKQGVELEVLASLFVKPQAEQRGGRDHGTLSGGRMIT